MSVQFSIIFYSSIAGLATILGIILVLMKKQLVLRHASFVNSFAAGLILGVAFFHLFPEAIELSEHALSFIFLGFICFFLLENVVVLHSGSEVLFSEKEHSQHTKGIVMFSGLFFHSLMDGVIIGIGFEIDSNIGLLTSLGVIFHELPEGVTTFSLLINTIKKKTALKLSIMVALATPIGAVISLTFVPGLSDEIIGAMLAMAGGSLLYISASDLIPQTHEEHGIKNAIFLLTGVAFLHILHIILPE